MFAVRFCAAVWISVAFPLPIAALDSHDAGTAVVVEKENIVEAQSRKAAWQPAAVGLSLALRDRLRTGEFSRAALRFADASMLRVDELTTVEISPPVGPGGRQSLEVQQGGTYFYSREREQEIEIRTPAANGALRGTEFELRVAASGRTRLTMFDGEVELGNAHGRVTLRSGEQAVVEVGRAPRKTAAIDAVNIIQWCLYYPAVLDPAELGLAAAKGRAAASLDAYGAGDLRRAAELHPLAARGGSAAERLYRANLILAFGQVDKARAALAGVPSTDSRRQAIERMIAAVKMLPWPSAAEPRTSSEWLAESYYQQSRGDLVAALDAARRAAGLSPSFGYAWARVAELEFSFGRAPRAMKTVERSLELAPRNAQAHALQGFLLSAENRIGAARRSFDTAIALDGALGNAWLGRGLTFIRQNRESEGRRDLQTAAVLEPNRSILRSYLGKAFSQVGVNAKANLELARAVELDAGDPTPWLYTAIQRKQENRYNEAIADLEKSVELNANRRVYRSEFLLDQDRAIRGANLASIYRNNGMIEQSVREAARAVDRDYASAPAHLFLSESYDALRDPTLVLARYETAWFNELLVAQLLAPVGGGSLSQFVSQQEYSKLFEKDRLGVTSLSEYRSDGQFFQGGSQFGTVGNLSYALDGSYRWDNGIRPNSEFSAWNGAATFKLQLGVRDSVFFQANFSRLDTGDLFQRYDNRNTGSIFSTKTEENGKVRTIRLPDRPVLTFHFSERQDPGTMLAGWQHEWSPGNHTLLLLGRLANRQQLTQQQTGIPVVLYDASLVAPETFDAFVEDQRFPKDPALRKLVRSFAGRGVVRNYTTQNFDLDYRASFETYTADLQQIVTVGPSTTVLGGRVQHGEFETRVALGNYNAGRNPTELWLFGGLPVRQAATVDLDRFSLYAYETLRLAPWLSLTGGVTYDHLQSPENFRYPPITGRAVTDDEVSPKAGIIAEPWRGAVLRGAYTRSLSGASFEESVRLEPTQVAGFAQAFRSVAPESIAGASSGSHFETFSGSFEQRFPSRTYLGFEYDHLRQNLDRRVGVFASESRERSFAILPASLDERGHYTEQSYTGTINQLLGDRWSLGARYSLVHSELHQSLPKIAGAADFTANETTLTHLVQSRIPRQEANLHAVSIFALYNHPSGFFLRGEANWFRQDSDEFSINVVPLAPGAPVVLPRELRRTNQGLPGDDFWQFNAFAGYRFYRNQCEVSVGGLNLGGQDYLLNPLSPYAELPRDRTLIVRCKFNF